MRSLAARPAYRIELGRPQYVIPFIRVDPLPQIVVRLADGRDHVFLFDTGAAETILDPTLADAVHVERIDGSTIGTFAGGQQAQVRFGTLDRLQIGDLAMSHVPVAVQPTTQFSAAGGGAIIESVMGVDLMRHFIETIDYPGARLTLRALGSASAEGSPVPFWIAEDHLLLAPATVDDEPVLALLDTGLAGFGCTMPRSTFDRIGAHKSGETVHGEGGGGHVEATSFNVRRIALGIVSEAGVSCLLGPFPPSLEQSTGTAIGLLVSHAFFRPYVITLDFGRMIVAVDRKSMGRQRAI